MGFFKNKLEMNFKKKNEFRSFEKKRVKVSGKVK